jgi:surfactin synthase thioesterase subunit
LQYILVQGKKLGVLPPGIGSEQMRHRLEVFKANYQASERYTPQPYLGRITFFCADESMKQNQDPTLGWASFAAGSITTHNIPGNHYSIIESEILAQKLRDCLN